MAGELWRSTFQIGKEVTAGTSVAATRKMYFTPDSRLNRDREGRAHRFATGTRDSVRAFTNGPVVAAGTLSMPLSASEILEFLLITLKGGVTPTGVTAKLWAFVPGSTALDAATVEWYDGARGWEATGVYGDKLKFKGSANGENTVSCELFAHNVTQQTITGSLVERVPDFIEGWETKLYLDAYAGTPRSTNKAATLLNWEVEFSNGLARKYFADNVNRAGGVTTGEFDIKAKLTVEASTAQALTEFDNWDAATKRLVGLEFGQNEVIDGADKKFVTVDIPGAWDAVDLGATDENTRAYELNLQYVYDITNAFGFQVRAQNARTAAY